ncbi:phosphate ABC transporter permease [Thermosipho melanesiensis]|uniref:Phosphate transport system permease protein PstA n=2 Tax=Thermosipho melanesiensis TaxID=46541 RepID=A6LP11_THEM4|nr:phosphate ABC transporter permease PstA [Thermosipho melanesiensis]ABR31662.1 phosphate ABC transporter, inner membrane subunit PstA [Thermosipho melanesiensis BI429]APT74689.1 phosphate ABC transporter permease [Thermosipho melanesiensis]OOC35186.1 phosphate ABC transporter permease [Thermosipho melanesiensis]OOC35396.1 phosphate ABC transporter permease [Thermosipho melanesiensis]OOC36647.1 phosphate ABC transporter permease [Thermosipho melanesiensis]
MDRIISVIFRIITFFVVLIIFLLIFKIIFDGARYFSVDFFTKYPTDGMTTGGIFPAILGSLYIVLLSIVFSVPLGIFTGIFLSEYKDSKLSKIVDLAVTSLSGLPSIVFGLFGYALFSIALGFGTSILSASLTLSLMALPVISSSTKEALLSLPVELKESAYSLGAKKNEVIFKVLIPAVKTNILTASLIGFGRTIGETAPVLVTGAVFYSTSLPKSIFSPVMTLPTHIYYLVAAYGKDSVWMASASSSALLIFVLVLYLIAFKVGGMRK